MPNPPSPITQVYESGIIIGGLQVPALPGFRGGTEENFMDIPIVGNFWQFTYAAGLQLPTVDVQLVVRDKSTEIFGSTFLNYFFSRSGDVANDTAVIAGGVTFFTGRIAYLLSGVKADQFSISGDKRNITGFSCRFCGTTWGTTSLPSLAAWDETPPLTMSNTDFGGILEGLVWRYGLTYSNNHRPNEALDGTNTPRAWNAGMRTAALNIDVREADFSGGNVPGTGSAISLIYTGANVTRTFNAPNVRLENPRMAGVEAPEVMRRFRYTLLGADGQTTPPLGFA